ncbi:MAG: thrombospondin type 3 repeat-containing protein, partial [Phycisphaerales bacterium]|nr:thrombospondin type 3 repeat-containing protein [Phycisphaerales bacterium]
MDLALTPENTDGSRGDGSDSSAFSLNVIVDLPKLPFQPDGTLFIPKGQEGDSDGDGLLDFWELAFFENLTVINASSDNDGDGATDEQEFEMFLDPTKADTDGDGATDGEELAAGSDPKDPESNPGVVADSIAEFSGTQGQDGWRYGYRNLFDDGGDIDYNANDDFIAFDMEDDWTGTSWALPRDQGSGPWTSMGPEDAHPNGENSFPNEEHWVIRRWVASEIGNDVPLAVTWHIREVNLAGTGVTGSLHLNGKQVDTLALAGGDAGGATRTYYLTAKDGDNIDLALTPLGADGDPGDGSDGSATWMRISTAIPATPFQPNGDLYIPPGQDTDSDGDTLIDFWELAFFPGDLAALSADGDADEDGLTDKQEFDMGLPPNNPDTDDDGFTDGEEVTAGTNPKDPGDSPGFIADSIAEFSGEQGQDNWRYGFRNLSNDGGGTDYNPETGFTEFGTDDVEWWNGSAWDWPDGNVPWTFIAEENSHPNGDNNGDVHWTIRRWEAEVTEVTPLAITWHVRKTNPAGNGVTGAVHHNGVRVDSATIGGTDEVGETRTYYLNANQGDVVDLILSPRGLNGTNNDGSDGSAFWMTVSTGIPAEPVQPNGDPFIPA